jgi:hypothetical protein
MPSKETIQTLVAHAQKNHLTEPDLDDLVHELKSAEASSINNGGINEQIEYIIEQLGPTDAMTKIDALIKEDN